MSRPPLLAAHLLEDFEREGVTHVVGLPDNDSAALFDRLETHAAIRLVRVAREGEAFAVASGLWLGGAHPVVVIQNTGLLESGDALRGTASRMGVPLVIVIGYRGLAKMEAKERRPGPPTRDEVVHIELDSVALMTEPTLEAWGVPAERLGGLEQRGRVKEAFSRARAEERPVALLLTEALA